MSGHSRRSSHGGATSRVGPEISTGGGTVPPTDAAALDAADPDSTTATPPRDFATVAAARRAPLFRELACAARAIEALAAGRSLPRALDDAIAAESAGEPLPAASRAAVRDLAYRSCRVLGLVRELARGLNARKPAPAPAALQEVALAQLVGSVRADAVIVDQAVRAAHALPGGTPVAGFMNATLRRFVRERAARLDAARRHEEARWNHPQWWIDRLRRAWPDRWEQILETGNGSAPMTLRVNRLRTTPAEYLSRLSAHGIAARPLGAQAIALDAPAVVDTLPGWHEGFVTVQDAAAQLAAHFLDPRDGERLLDACAAPGGKTTHLLELADVELTALDIDAARLAAVRESLERLGFAAERGATPGADGRPDAAHASMPRCADAAQAPTPRRPVSDTGPEPTPRRPVSDAGPEPPRRPVSDAAPQPLPRRPAILVCGDASRPADWWDGRPFDRILVDAPCTASGIVRRHPDVRWLRRRSDLATLPRRQSEILGALWPTLRPGGKLLYTTCSVFPEEGEGVITLFLEKHRDASRLPLQWRFDVRTPESTPESVSTLLPVATPMRDHDGFFFALLEKHS
ncbi:MAG: 16S rRNA (cytosine(967)-C(5))-methyltransferase RsmB [Burkholderiaceae bacterium]|nr:16S rRNA (cytosine(967)-C(5))-methyltransferase RsmB [Burkholderiaceae bacterium]